MLGGDRRLEPIVRYALVDCLARLSRHLEYEAGINHAKIALLDEDCLMAGSDNFDVRSLHLNFERNALVCDRDRAGDLERMLRHDFEHGSHEVVEAEFLGLSRLQLLQESLLRPLAALI